MAGAAEKLDWFPLYFQRLKASAAWKMPDYQFCWYMKLLIESADSPVPGYLPGSLDKLWQIAGAKSQSYFEKWGGCELVTRLFRRTEIEGQTWIYNERMLQVIHEQGKKLTKRRRRSVSSLSLCIQGLPDWIPEEEFRSYMEMREKIRKPLTTHAIRLLVGKLEKLRDAGDDPKQVLNEAEVHCWLSVYPLRKEANGNGSGKQIHQAGKCPIPEHANSGTGPGGECWGCHNESPEEVLERIRRNHFAANSAAGR